MGTMNCQTTWKHGSTFEADLRSHKILLDTKIESGGTNKGPSPKELLLAGICGCSGMDVISILQKMRLTVEHFDVSATTETTEGHPSIFKHVLVTFTIKSFDAKPEQVLRAVQLSMTKYCGVSAMIVKASPISYEVLLNDEKVGEGHAEFSPSVEA